MASMFPSSSLKNSWSMSWPIFMARPLRAQRTSIRISRSSVLIVVDLVLLILLCIRDQRGDELLGDGGPADEELLGRFIVVHVDGLAALQRCVAEVVSEAVDDVVALDRKHLLFRHVTSSHYPGGIALGYDLHFLISSLRKSARVSSRKAWKSLKALLMSARVRLG